MTERARSATNGLTPLFDAGFQLVKVRAMMLFALACALGAIWWGVDLAQAYGMNPGDGGVLRPLPERLAWARGVTSLGLVFAAGMWLYGRCYVARASVDEQSGVLHLETVDFFRSRTHRYDLTAIRGSHRHASRLDLGRLGPSVNAPWRSVQIAGRRLPLIVDEQGIVYDEQLMSKLF